MDWPVRTQMDPIYGRRCNVLRVARDRQQPLPDENQIAVLEDREGPFAPVDRNDPPCPLQ